MEEVKQQSNTQESGSTAPQQDATQQAAPVPQPVAPQAPTQYVVMEKSLNGVGGWLIFWLVIYALAGIGYIATFFTSISSPNIDSAIKINNIVFSLLLAVASIGTVVMIAMQKKLGKTLALATLGISATYTVINSILTYNAVSEVVSAFNSYSGAKQRSMSILISSIVISLVIHGLVALYFILSKRVKATLVK